MEQNEIIEGNRLIAEFIGYKNLHSPNWYAMDDQNVKGFYIDDTFSYNTSWNWLMPVVEKIFKIDGKILNDGKRYGNPMKTFYQYRDRIKYELSQIIIQAVWLAIIDFIKWYNQNK